ELSYVEGKNLIIDWRYAERGPADLPLLAKTLVDLHPDVLVAITTPATAAVKSAAGGIPIVFAYVGDPVATGFVSSLAHPGGNLTGQSIVASELSAKRLQLLKEVIPASSTMSSCGIRPIRPLSCSGMRRRRRLRGWELRLVSFEVHTAAD